MRRKKIWDDFKRSRECYCTPERILKVTFSGEPAVDSGGPKREFFAGIVLFSFANEDNNLCIFFRGVLAQGLG